MIDDMVMRSVYLRPAEDAQLRDLAHRLSVTKSDLIRSAIAVKLLEWIQSNDAERLMSDLEFGKRDEAAIRSGRRGRRRAETAAAAVLADADEVEALPAPEAAPASDTAPEQKRASSRARPSRNALV